MATAELLVQLTHAAGQTNKVHGSPSPFVNRKIECAGPFFLSHARRILRGRTWSEDEKIEQAANFVATEETEEDDLGDEPEDPQILQHDPKEWKELDLYAALGLSKLRYKATEDQIRRAHRRKVLKHHPDKKAAQGAIDDDRFFKCLQKAFEVLMDPVKRKQFDSVDEGADVPPPENYNSKKLTDEEFIEGWGKFFEAEARFSKIQPVPMLGDMNSSKEEVEAFYKFWFNFDSWRSFEYLDEDVPDDSDNRDNKRHIEKKNKAARAKAKTEDVARLRSMVDAAFSKDPRMKKFRLEEKKEKERLKWEREAESRKAAEEAKKAAEEEAKRKEEEERKAKEQRESQKKNKEAAKNARKKSKRTIKAAAKDADFEVEVESLIEAMDDVQLSDSASKLSDAGDKKAAFVEIARGLVADGKIDASSFPKLLA
ncbi:hypothetical protein CANCADRAFT_776 [Tortispora caseinolytica NRRL Y-17796]|uniref:J domain-containing protein n=1 Tax=Tortispora caseinolytica NRRL Y-17796 TaxID=767744 RepID=A0A1E4TKL1_9ASCO|nr:hypothetical protein CANCADRAFT_776 [Tortispora caseinolytica NRRL Y-17796]